MVLASYNPSHPFNIEPVHRSRSSRIFTVHNRTTTLTMGIVAKGKHFIVGGMDQGMSSASSQANDFFTWLERQLDVVSF